MSADTEQLNGAQSAAPYSPRNYLFASVVTAVFPAICAWLFTWLIPAACEMGGEKSVYRWTCLLPGLLKVVPAVVALVLPLVVYVGTRLGRKVSHGVVALSLGSGIVVHVVLMGTYAILLGPAYWEAALPEMLLILQPFVSGFVAGAI